MTIEAWSSVLKRARQYCEAEKAGFLEEFQVALDGWASQISCYIDLLSEYRKEDQVLASDEKIIISETRSAIRFGLCCFSFLGEEERIAFQTRAVEAHRWHVSLSNLLSMERGDSKCRVFAAKLLSNLVASSDVSALALSTDIKLSPSAGEVSDKLQNSVTSASEQEIISPPSSTWVDMIIMSSRGRDREALAGVVAALYNCLLALSPNQSQRSFGDRVAHDPILISTLLRQFIPVTSINMSTKESKGPQKVEDWDAATEWIVLLISQLFGWGQLPTMYSTIGGPNAASTAICLPEQNVLVHCAAQEAQSFVDDSTTCRETLSPFGGEAGVDVAIENYAFLADLFLRLSGIESPSRVDEDDIELSKSAALCSLDTISISLGVDSVQSTILRKHLGTETGLIRTSSLILGRLVDELTDRSIGLKARDLTLSSEEQQWMVSLVRLLANICYRCRENQDRIRNTLVPMLRRKEDEANSSAINDRNALHVLLSCTSFATSCFTLREWGVIAIRNILHENEENQNLVASLDAQNPVQTAALDKAGVRVKLDSCGTVSLTPLEEATDH